MGGLADFEQVLGNSAGVPQAMQAYGSPLRLAEGGASWLGPFQRARLAGAAGAMAEERRHGPGAEDVLSQAKDFNKIGRAAMTPSEQDAEGAPMQQPGLDFSAMTESASPYLPKGVSDFGRGALRGAKHWPQEAAEFLSLPASIPLNALVEHYTGMTPEDIKARQRHSLGRDHSDFSYPNQEAIQRRWNMSPKERELEDFPSMTAAPSRAENIGQETASWLNPALIAGPLAELGNLLARPVVKAASASTRRAYRIPRQVPLSRGLQSRPYDYARFGSGAGAGQDIPESIQAGLGVK